MKKAFTPWHLPILFVALYLLIAWNAVFAMDICVLVSDKDYSPASDFLYYPRLIDKLFFAEGSISELLQRLFLILSACLAATCIIRFKKKKAGVTAGWWLLAAGLILLYIEDAHNIRHLLTAFAGESLPGIDAQSDEWRTSSLRTGLEMAVFALLGAVMAAALILILLQKQSPKVGSRLFVMGYVLYGSIAFASATRKVGEWYSKTGDWILSLLPKEVPTPWEDVTYQCGLHISGFRLMDGLIEESIELIAASLLLAAIIAHYQHYRQRLSKSFPEKSL